MKKRRKKNKIPKAPLFIFFAIIGAIFAYLYLPVFNKTPDTKIKDITEIIPQKKVIEQPKEETKQVESSTNESLFSKYYRQSATVNLEQKKLDYNNLYEILDELKTLSVTHPNTPNTIVDALLQNRQYPKGLLKVEFENIPTSITNNQTTLTVAYFDILSGVIKINKTALNKINTEKLVAILAHEIDHFDTVAKIYKTYNLKDKMELNLDYTTNIKLHFNKVFWDKASEYSNTKYFQARDYLPALLPYIHKEEFHTLSLYPYLSTLATITDNQFEKKAYSISNTILDYYNIKQEKLSILSFTEEFKKLDSNLNTILTKYNFSNEEKEAIFDYILFKTVIEKNSNYKTYFDESMLYKNKDMTQILKAIIENNKILFTKKIDIKDKTYTQIIDLIKQMELKASNDITVDNILEAMEIQINTIKNNIYKQSTIDFLKKKILKYLEYINKNKINKPEQELNYLITLICIENDINTNSQNEFSTYYSKLPTEIEKIYEVNDSEKMKNLLSKSQNAENVTKRLEKENKLKIYKIIYNNPIFVEKKENIGSDISNSDLLKKLINENKINIKNIVQ